MDGVLVIDKPAGPTSHDVVAVARRALRERRIGHTGTLDPMATGVLPLVIGRATRLATLLSSTQKEYEADVRLGGATATYDAADRLRTGGAPPEPPQLRYEELESAVDAFRGTFEQLPPPFSAKKVGGVPSYKLARQDAAPPLSPVPVTVHALEIVAVEGGVLRLRLRTSAGFYVRSLAHDIGMRLGCGAHLEALRRTRAGAFALDDAVGLEVLAQDPAGAAGRVIPLGRLLPDFPAVLLTPSGVRKATHGNPLSREDFAETGPVPVFGAEAQKRGQAPSAVRLLDADGGLVGIARGGADGVLRPAIVLV